MDNNLIHNVTISTVDQLATLYDPKSQKERYHGSFASKFAHFFIDKDRFPLMDNYAKKMVKFHLKKEIKTSNSRNHEYIYFLKDLKSLRKLSDYHGSIRELDRYLWLAGQYRHWLKNRNVKINVELKSLFENSSQNGNQIYLDTIKKQFQE